MQIRIAGTVNDSIVDGPGLRYTVFVQGCPHRCPGCHNPETWDKKGGKYVDTADILLEVQKNPLLQGLTLSGGEPFLQVKPCIDLAVAVHFMGKNIWCYTGYTFEELTERDDPNIRTLLKLCDVLVDGPYIQEQRSLDLLYRGSKNQRLIDLKKTGSVLPGAIPVLWREPNG